MKIPALLFLLCLTLDIAAFVAFDHGWRFGSVMFGFFAGETLVFAACNVTPRWDR